MRISVIGGAICCLWLRGVCLWGRFYGESREMPGKQRKTKQLWRRGAHKIGGLSLVMLFSLQNQCPK